MADRHLNLFYSYHIEKSSLLCEDNLTRAFIQTLRLLSGPVRGRFLSSLFRLHEESAELSTYDYTQAETALQNHMDKSVSMNCARKRIITLATHRPEEAESGKPTEERYNEGGSKPDAWIFDNDQHEYCLLLECKRGGNPVADDQILRHAKEWFGINGEETKSHTIAITWQDVLRAIEQTIVLTPEPDRHLENCVLNSLAELLGFFGYRLFKGFRFEKLGYRSAWQLRAPVRRAVFRFGELRGAPGFRLRPSGARTPERSTRFCFDRVKPSPNFRLRGANEPVTAMGNRQFRFDVLGPVPAFKLVNQGG